MPTINGFTRRQVFNVLTPDTLREFDLDLPVHKQVMKALNEYRYPSYLESELKTMIRTVINRANPAVVDHAVGLWVSLFKRRPHL